MRLSARLTSQSLLTCSQAPGEHPLRPEGGPPAPGVQASSVPDVLCGRAPCVREPPPSSPSSKFSSVELCREHIQEPKWN